MWRTGKYFIPFWPYTKKVSGAGVKVCLKGGRKLVIRSTRALVEILEVAFIVGDPPSRRFRANSEFTPLGLYCQGKTALLRILTRSRILEILGSVTYLS